MHQTYIPGQTEGVLWHSGLVAVVMTLLTSKFIYEDNTLFNVNTAQKPDVESR